MASEKHFGGKTAPKNNNNNKTRTGKQQTVEGVVGLQTVTQLAEAVCCLHWVAWVEEEDVQQEDSHGLRQTVITQRGQTPKPTRTRDVEDFQTDIDLEHAGQWCCCVFRNDVP